MTNNSCRKYYVLLFPLVIVFLVFVQLTNINAQSPGKAVLLVPSPATVCNSYSEESIDVRNILSEISEKTIIGHNINKPQVKYWKKYKRGSSVSLGIRQPVRNIEARIFDTNGNSTYIKPFFLSHLHSFLFRLTPF